MTDAPRRPAAAILSDADMDRVARSARKVMDPDDPNPPELLAFINRLLANAPGEQAIVDGDQRAMAWSGEVRAVLRRWDSIQCIPPLQALSNIGTPLGFAGPYRQVITALHEARKAVEMRYGLGVAVAINAEAPFQYFDQIRQFLERATGDLLIVDRYLEAEFVARYMPFVRDGVVVRLLTRDRVAQLTPAVEMFAREHGTQIQIRTNDRVHDRYVFVDRESGYFSGASIKDGGIGAPSLVMQINDAFAATFATYDAMWNEGNRVR